MGSNDAANTGVTNGGGAKGSDAIGVVGGEDGVDRFVVDGGSNRHGEERVDKLRNCSMFNRGAPAGGDGFDHFLNTFINDPVVNNVGQAAGLDAAPSHGFLRNAFSTFSAKVPGDVRDIADAGDRGDLHGDFVSSMLDGEQNGGHDEGARFGYLFPGSVVVGVDAVDLPEGCAATRRVSRKPEVPGPTQHAPRAQRTHAMPKAAAKKGAAVIHKVCGL